MSSRNVDGKALGTLLALSIAGYCPPLLAQNASAPSDEASKEGQSSTREDSSVVAGQANAADLAQQRFREATEAYGDERYAAAASLFEAADRLAPHASNRFNAAAAWEQAGELARAATGYQAALAQGAIDGELGEARRQTANERLSALRSNLGQIRVYEPLGALLTVDHVQRLVLPARFYLQPGTYRFNLEFQGNTHHKSEQIYAGQLTKLDFGLALPATAPQTVPPSLPPTADSPSVTGPSGWTWVAFGAGLALSGLAANFGTQALSAKRAYLDSRTTDNYNKADSLELATNLAWGGAATAGVAGVILLFASPTVEF